MQVQLIQEICAGDDCRHRLSRATQMGTLSLSPWCLDVAVSVSCQGHKVIWKGKGLPLELYRWKLLFYSHKTCMFAIDMFKGRNY